MLETENNKLIDNGYIPKGQGEVKISSKRQGSALMEGSETSSLKVTNDNGTANLKYSTVVYVNDENHIGNTSSIRIHSNSVHENRSKWLLKKRFLKLKYLILAVISVILGAILGALTVHYTNIDTICYTTESKFKHNNICLTEECVRSASHLLDAMDITVNPCEDFFQYACGTWNKKHVIPEDKSSISTFEVLADNLQIILKDILEEPITEDDNQATIKAKTFYKSCMDIRKRSKVYLLKNQYFILCAIFAAQIRKFGEDRLKQILKSLGGWPVIESDWQLPKMTIEELLGDLRRKYSESVLVELYVGADDKNSSAHILQIDQLSLALPSRDYYLKSSSENALKAYHKYMIKTAVLLGANPEIAEHEFDQVLQFEIQLANATLPEADRHDTSAIYNKISLIAIQAQFPELNWTLFLQESLGPNINLQPKEELVVYAVSYLTNMCKLLNRTDRRILHNYALWRLVMSIMAHMVDEYQQERFEFRRILLGIQSERDRWGQCVEWTNKKLGMAVGALFIRNNFDQKSKEIALEMIRTIREAFNELLAENHWMDDETRAVAKEKADTMNERIGYPDILTNVNELEKEYLNLTIIPDNYLANILNILQWETEKNMELLRQPVDKEKWTTEPAVVNAFYNPNKNDIGRQFDKHGNMMQWWNNATIEAFRGRTQCIIDQYSKYKVDEVDQYMNGRMTQGENIADNGGLKQAFRAYKKWVKQHGSELLLPGLNLTHDQLFFLNYAQIWCGSMRPEDALTKIRSSVHSPGSIRVLGPLSNSKDFAEAYQCPPGSPMNPIEKCSVW
uniref:Peptidase M13 N-terminal domain-containing protein n=1 Tax=Glossina brevipalpis TaxID=37001 RepID=A0A1A9WAX6_9MUSC